MVLLTSRNGWDSLTDEDRLGSRRICDQIPSALSVLENIRQPLLHPGQRQQAAFGTVLWESFLCLSAFWIFPPACWSVQTSGQAVLGTAGPQACPHTGCRVSLAFSSITVPLSPETHCMVGGNKVSVPPGGRKQSVTPDLKHCS